LKLYRNLLFKTIWLNSSPEQKSILITLLLMVNHQKNKWEWKGEQFTVVPGQLITSLESIKAKCGKGVSIQNIRTALKRFKKLGFLTDESTKTGRLITIINWKLYQSSRDETNNDVNSQSTDISQKSGKDLTSNKEGKNAKKVRKNKGQNTDPPSPEVFITSMSAALRGFCNKNDIGQAKFKDHVEECFDHFLSKGEQKADWEATVRNWIRSPYNNSKTRSGRTNLKQSEKFTEPGVME